MLQQSLNHFKFNQPDITFAPYKSSQAYDEWFCAQTVYILNVLDRQVYGAAYLLISFRPYFTTNGQINSTP